MGKNKMCQKRSVSTIITRILGRLRMQLSLEHLSLVVWAAVTQNVHNIVVVIPLFFFF